MADKCARDMDEKRINDGIEKLKETKADRLNHFEKNY